MLKEEIKNQAIILSTLTSGLYVYGMSFYQGYLGFWGLEPELFALPFEKMLFNGFYAFAWLGIEALLPLALIAFSWVIVCLLWNVVLAKLKALLSRIPTFLLRLRNPKSKIELQDPPKWAVQVVLALLGILMILFGLLSVWILLFVADKYGKRAGESQFEKFLKSPTVNTFHVKDKPPMQGSIITCSTTHCGLLVEKKVLVFPVGEVLSYERVTRS